MEVMNVESNICYIISINVLKKDWDNKYDARWDDI